MYPQLDVSCGENPRVTVFPEHEPLTELTVVVVKELQTMATPWGGKSWAREVLR